MFQGSFVALVTPFKNGSIDYTALENLIHFHLENGTDGIVLLGTTAETTGLAMDEKDALLRFAMQRINHKVPVIIGTGDYNLQHTIAATQKAKAIGANGALIITPYYIKPTQTGLYEFFKSVADKVDIPIVIYNVPGRTQANILPATVIQLARECKNIVGIKEASGNLIQASEIIRDAPEGFTLLSGEDGLNMPLMAIGGKGTISVTANIVPKRMSEHIHTCLDGDYVLAGKQHRDLTRLNQNLFIETNPIPVKEALHMMGMIELEYRLPMCKLADGNRKILHGVLKEYGLI